METFSAQWLVIIMNAIVIALILTAPLLLAILFMRILRKGVSQDRQVFEEEIRSKLGEISISLAEIKNLVERSKNDQELRS